MTDQNGPNGILRDLGETESWKTFEPKWNVKLDSRKWIFLNDHLKWSEEPTWSNGGFTNQWNDS
jgi:hypothetical protein